LIPIIPRGHALYSELNPVATEAVVLVFEAKENVKLPSGYRRYLLEIGNGGPGLSWNSVNRGQFVSSTSILGIDGCDLCDDLLRFQIMVVLILR